ncbi:UDP-glycosyltransferase 75C1-like [Punica granatum]|uniref:Glycosyltransferase n=1 Tax=Punica granatum TaxID=22663 RepID=A0A6P8DXC8_PUNGR|nr:UDP-glycosyltransferase 75C1-like [Punica granatum]
MKNQHFLIISCAGQGHINPSLQLAKHLIHSGARVTFITTARGLDAMKSRISLDGLSYASFSDRFDDGDRPAEGKAGDSPMLEMRLAGSRSLGDLITSLLSDGPITCLIYTVLLPWAAEVARRFHIPSVFLSIQSATTFAIYRRFFDSRNGLCSNGDYSQSIESIMLHDQLPPFESHDLPSFLLPDNPHSAVIPTFHEHIQILEDDPNACVLLNSFHALEEHTIDAADDISLIPIGPLLPSAYIEGTKSCTDVDFGCDLFNCSRRDYIQWLDAKSNSSVVYASFGSMVVLNEDQIGEIFQGLLETNRPFLLVIRPNDNAEGTIANKMKGYLDGQEQGLIVPWCSQVEVLNHPAVGCFVTHCGWNSTLESLAMCVPIVACPHFSDQLTNAKMVDEVWKNGIRVRARDGGGLVEREEIRRCVEVVMGDGERGEEIRRNALKWKGLAMEAVKEEGGPSHHNLRVFMDRFK